MKQNRDEPFESLHPGHGIYCWLEILESKANVLHFLCGYSNEKHTPPNFENVVERKEHIELNACIDQCKKKITTAC